MTDDDQTATEATAEDIARAIDDALFHALGSRRMATTWVLIAEVADDDGDRFPHVFEAPEASWNEVLGLLTVGSTIMQAEFAAEIAQADDVD